MPVKSRKKKILEGLKVIKADLLEKQCYTTCIFCNVQCKKCLIARFVHSPKVVEATNDYEWCSCSNIHDIINYYQFPMLDDLNKTVSKISAEKFTLQYLKHNGVSREVTNVLLKWINKAKEEGVIE